MKYIEQVTKIVEHGKAEPCLKTGFSPMKITTYGYNYSPFSGHEYKDEVDGYDCKGCSLCGNGCYGGHYDTINSKKRLTGNEQT